MDKNKVDELIENLTLEEKASLLCGADFWHTVAIERLDIPGIMMTDGPHGLRKQEVAIDDLSPSPSKTAICFPAGCAQAASFDPSVSNKIGKEIGRIARSEHVSAVLGPAMNIKRDPRCGRNFEYYSEDPLLSTKMASGSISGIQSMGVGACAKHFLANSQEYYRMSMNAIIDERTLREIYLASFEGAVKETKPWMIMNSYNQVNGKYSSDNREALTDILRGEWGFDGMVVSDWGGCNDPIKAVKAGMDLQMPGPVPDNTEYLISAVNDGRITETEIDTAASHVLGFVLRAAENKAGEELYDFEKGHELAVKAEEECAVLLKNDEGMLPLENGERILLLGEYARSPRYQGGGSSHIVPYRIDAAVDFISGSSVTCLDGFDDENPDRNSGLLSEAVNEAPYYDKIVIFAGLPESFETEAMDRKHIDMPDYQNELISKVSEVNGNVAVVLHNGSAVTMPWIDNVKAVLEMYLGGEGVGQAAADLLYGKAVPCGRLPETFPLKIEDVPAYPYYGRERFNVPYREGVLVGYRWYETMGKDVLFPFGHGLSYAEFKFSDFSVDRDSISDNEELRCSVRVENTGSCSGKAVVQIYVAPPASDIVRPVRELKGFEAVILDPGESKIVEILLDSRAFAYWDEKKHDWKVESGKYIIQLGESSEKIITEKEVNIRYNTVIHETFTLSTPIGDIMKTEIGESILKQSLYKFAGLDENGEPEDKSNVFHKEALIEQAKEMPLRNILSFFQGTTREDLNKMLDIINKN